jgi:hypothetical protein
MSWFVDHRSSPPLLVYLGRISASCRPPQEWPRDVKVVDCRSGPVVRLSRLVDLGSNLLRQTLLTHNINIGAALGMQVA